MFTRPAAFLKMWTGAFFGNLMPRVLNMSDELEKEKEQRDRSKGKGKGRRSPPVRNAAAHKRAAKKAKGRAINKARHA